MFTFYENVTHHIPENDYICKFNAYGQMKNITIKDVAREANVSVTLVSRVMNAPLDQNGQPLCSVNRNTAARIIDTVKRMGYRPNMAAASLRRKTKKRIGVILPDISHPYFAAMAREFETIARKEGYTVLFGSSIDSVEVIEDLAMTFMFDNTDGIILIPGQDCEKVAEKIVNQRIPLVLAVRNIPDVENVGRVLPDNEKATAMALDHLLSSGFRKIDMVSPVLRVSTVIEREKQFSKRCESLGIVHRILHCGSDALDDSLAYIIEDIERHGTHAIYCPNESIPLSMVKICRDNGIRIPDDIAIFGYDGGKYFNITTPTITQIAFPKQKVAREAFSILQEMVSKGIDGIQTVYIEPELITGASTTVRTDENRDSKKTALNPIDHIEKAISEMQTARQLCENRQILQTQRITDGKRDK